MENGDDGTRRGRRLMMGDDERAMVGAPHRAVSRGVPTPWDDEDEVTRPERVLERNLTDLEIMLLDKIGINAGETATKGDVAKLLLRDYRRAQDHQSGNREIGRQIDEIRKLLETPPNSFTASLQVEVGALQKLAADLETEIEDVSRSVQEAGDEIAAARADAATARAEAEAARATVVASSRVVANLRDAAVKQRRALKWARGVAVTAVVAAMSSIGTGIVKVYAIGEQYGEAVIRLRTAESAIDQLRQDFRADRSREDHQPSK